MRALGKAIALFLAIVTLAQFFIVEVFAIAQLAREEFVRQQRVAQPRFHISARHAGRLQRLRELLVGADVVLLLQAVDRFFDFGVRDGDAEAVGALFDEKLGDRLIDHVLANLFATRSQFVGRRVLLGFIECFAETFRVLRARDDAVADANDDCFDEIGRARGAGDESDGKSQDDLLHIQCP